MDTAGSCWTAAVRLRWGEEGCVHNPRFLSALCSSMTTRICLNYKNPKKDDSGGVVPDYEPSGVEELLPFLDGSTKSEK